MAVSLSTASSTSWILSGQLADGEPMRHARVDSSPFIVGRSSDSSLCLPYPTVSSRHAELFVGEQTITVRDLGSTNGTFVNGVRITNSCEARHGDLIQFAQIVFRACEEALNRNTATVQSDSGDRALALIQFDKLVTDRAVCPHYQPIVWIDSGEAFGYEVLGRSRLFGLTDPHAMFSTASVLNMEDELSRIFRTEGLREADVLPAEQTLFLNTHPVELQDLDLLEFSLHELRSEWPNRPLVLEIHEKAATYHEQMKRLRKELDNLNVGLAYDDFGAGQARLVELIDVPPDYLKFDMKLVQGISAAPPERQTMLARLVEMVIELGIAPLAEGIETEEDHHACQQIGFTCAQGFHYGRPALPRDLIASS